MLNHTTFWLCIVRFDYDRPSSSPENPSILLHRLCQMGEELQMT